MCKAAARSKREKLLSDAKAIEEAGAFAIVLELVTDELAAWITKQLSIPTIGIGSGVHCDGQVLVYHDLLQYGSDSAPRKFVKAYANIGETIRAGIGEYVKEVKARTFPAQKIRFIWIMMLFNIYTAIRSERPWKRSRQWK